MVEAASLRISEVTVADTGTVAIRVPRISSLELDNPYMVLPTT